MKDKETLEEIKLFLSFIYLKHPFYNSLLSSIDLELERTELSKKYDIYSKGNKSINIDYDFANKKIRENKKLFFYYIIHELLHIVLKHKIRGSEKDKKKWNRAIDISVDMIVKKDKVLSSLIQTPDEADNINKIYDIESAEDIYMRIKNQKEEGKGRKKEKGNSHLKNHELWENFNEEINILDSQKIDEMLLKAAQMVKLQEGNKIAGGLPGGFEEIINELIQPKTSLLSYITKVVQSFKKHQTNYKRGDRRYLYRGLIVPSQIRNIKHFKLLFYIDTSGSVRLEELQKSLSEIYYVINSLKSYEIDIIQSDAGVQEVYKITNKENLDLERFLTVKGRGGTEIKPLFKHLENENYDMVLVSSDYHIMSEELEGLENLQNDINIGFLATENYDKKIKDKLTPIFETN